MNYKRSSTAGRRGDDEVNITPVMNLFLVLIPFLLLTAEFVRIAVLELNLPSAASAPQQQTQQNNKPLVLIMLRIEDNQIRIKAPKIDGLVRKEGDDFEFDKLVQELKKLKTSFPNTQEVTVQPTDNIRYDTIVHVMDACRDNGFPNVSISG
ncbi:MAG: biopolymer transporter ExbD [Deferribacteres bacterium]|nr:biopolymer transporter ExbD [candidate division KSB1 bacterium]MCB9503981.1 biopolymer transporter ExbD [Deferribacteres bacterium]